MKLDKLKIFQKSWEAETNKILSDFTFSRGNARSLYKNHTDIRDKRSVAYEIARKELEAKEQAKEQALAEAKDKALQEKSLEINTTIDHTHEEVDTSASSIEYYIRKGDDRFYLPGCTGRLWRFQWNCAEKIWEKLVVKKQNAVYVQAPVGTGKTYMAGAVIKRILDNNSLRPTMSPYPVVIVTKANVVPQFCAVLQSHFGLKNNRDVLVTNYDQFRSNFGKMFLNRTTIVKNGEPVIKWEWIPFMTPSLFILDEAHSLKNEGSVQAEIFRAVAEVEGTKFIHMSATAATRVADMRTFYKTIRRKLSDIYDGTYVETEYPECEDQWMPFAKSIAVKGDPYDHAPAAMERLAKILSPWIINVPSPSGKFRSINRCELIPFESDEDRKIYELSYERYLEQCRRAQKEPASGHFALLVAANMHRKCAEELRAPILARKAHQDVLDGKAPCITTCFKSTIAKCVRILCSPKYGYTRDDISIIWGGSDMFSAQTRLTPEDMQKYLLMQASGEDIPKKILRQIEAQLMESAEDTKAVEDTADLNLRLGTQSRDERQREIHRFQTGKTKLCLYTYAAGGVGLSLHHTDRLDSGEEVSLLPRTNWLTPTYSAQEIIQGFGRPHRSIFSLSDTIQTVLFFEDTVEVRVMEKNKRKLACLSKLLRSRNESWMSLLNRETEDQELNEEIIEDTENNNINLTESESTEEEE